MKIPEEAKSLLETKVVAIGTSGEYPNVTPVLYCKVVENQVVITDNFMGETAKSIKADGKICLAAWEDKKGEEYGYKLFGQATYFTEGKWLEFVKNMPENKGMPAKGAIVFEPEKIVKI